MARKPVSGSGRQQRPTFSDHEPTLVGIPKAQQPLDLTIEVLSADKFHWAWEINGETVPALEDGWLEKAGAACPGPLTGGSKKQLKGIVENYLHRRFAIVTSTSHRDIVSKSEKIREAAGALQTAIEIHDHGDVLVWNVLEEIDPQNFRRDEVYPVITQLTRRGDIATANLTARSAKTRSTFEPQRVWEDFATGLLDIFEVNNWAVTIAKSTGGELKDTQHPSKFVNFAWIVISSIPRTLRERDNSPWTLAQALSLVRAGRRKRKSEL
jgi:hypothetical protein